MINEYDLKLLDNFLSSPFIPDEMRPLLTQLIGAVALLVLLGISWGFGASAAITYTEPESDSVSVWYFILQVGSRSVYVERHQAEQ